MEGVHYIPYNNDTLKEKVDYYLAHDEEGKKIGEAAAEFYTKHLTFDNILTYWEWLLLSMIRLVVVLCCVLCVCVCCV